MKPEQYERLQKRIVELTDVFLDESDPTTWPGAGVPAANQDRETRGDAYWVKKTAAASLSLVMRMHSLTGAIRLAGQQGVPPESGTTPEAEVETDLDRELAVCESEAKKLMNKAINEAKKREFDKRTHGKA